MSVTVKEIAWLAGLLEGEGSFRLQRKSVNIAIAMTDEDVIANAGRLFGQKYTRLEPKKEGYKPQFHITFSGRRAAAWMMTVYSFMGFRRRGKIRFLLDKWRSESRNQYHENVVCGHTDRPKGVKGRCMECYEKHRPSRPTNPHTRKRWRAANRVKVNGYRMTGYYRKKRKAQESLF